MKKKPIQLLDIGHSNRSIGTFMRKLVENEVEVLIDVRRYPFSRRHPHFSSQGLEKALQGFGIIYLDFGSTLGGLGEKPPQEDFMRSVMNVLRLAKMKRVCLMCAEGDPLKCHRYLELEPIFTHLGATITHISYQKWEK